jgi:hypothetical protein
VSALRAITAALALAAAGCVSGERSDVAEARAAYEQCLEQHVDGDRECAALRERLKAAQERYENNAQRAWGCAPEQEDCPSHR